MERHRPPDDPDDVVLYRVERGVAVITLNRPDRLNAWTPRLKRRHIHRLRLATETPDVRVVVVTGAGRAFCAGADTSILGGLTGGASPGTERARPAPVAGPRVQGGGSEIRSSRPCTVRA